MPEKFGTYFFGCTQPDWGWLTEAGPCDRCDWEHGVQASKGQRNTQHLNMDGSAFAPCDSLWGHPNTSSTASPAQTVVSSNIIGWRSERGVWLAAGQSDQADKGIWSPTQPFTSAAPPAGSLKGNSIDRPQSPQGGGVGGG